MDREHLDKLQKLSNISLDENQKDNFLKKLDPIIQKLDELGKLDLSNISNTGNVSNTLRVIDQTKNFPNKKEILENVEHEIINNSIVVKSVI